MRSLQSALLLITDFTTTSMDPIGRGTKEIEKRMKELVKRNITIERRSMEMTLGNVRQNPFKLEILDDKIGHDVGSSGMGRANLSICRGPHVSTSQLRWFDQHKSSLLEGK